ncbi:MAG: hypothetical protein GYB65_06620 [Chloroflexi bacterium]|nr:hypothetical protein [Chloroflexota bacterium]
MARDLIAIGIDDQGQVWGGHFGIAPRYAIYDRGGTLVETRVNPYGAGQGQKQQHHDNPQWIVDLLPECGVFIARRMGKPQMVEALGIRAVLTAEQTPSAALAAFLAETDNRP